MTKYWKYIQCLIMVVLVIELGYFAINKAFSKEKSVSSLELALRMAKDNRTEPVSYTHLDVYKRQPLSLCHS